jgi:hypothetical protein
MSDSPIRAVQQIEKNICRQLDHWKRHRFERAERKPARFASSP